MEKNKRKKFVVGVVIALTIVAIVVGIVFLVIIANKNKDESTDQAQSSTEDQTHQPTQEEINRSKELVEEIKNDVKDRKPEEFNVIIDTKQNELNQVKQKLADLKNSGASEDEIAKAEEKQQEIEKQLVDVKEEQSYWSVTAIIKDLYAKNLSNSENYPNSYIRRINRIGDDGVRMCIDADVISKDSNGILRSRNVVISIAGRTSQNISTAQGMAEFFSSCSGMEIKFDFDDTITDFEQAFFENYYVISNYCFENSHLLASKTTYDENGNLSSISVKVRDDESNRVLYHSFSLKKLSNDYTN